MKSKRSTFFWDTRYISRLSYALFEFSTIAYTILNYSLQFWSIVYTSRLLLAFLDIHLSSLACHSSDPSVTATPSKAVKKRTQARIIRSVWFNKEAQAEKQYRELLMLFTSWRNEETDLLKNYSSFKEHYLA